MQFKVHKNERNYARTMMLLGALFYLWIVMGLLTCALKADFKNLFLNLFIIAGAVAFSVLIRLWFLGYLRGNAIKVDEKQFPDVFEIMKAQSQQLDLPIVPDFYLLQGGGILNAFAARLSGKNHVVLYSDIFALAYQEGKSAVAFIIGHELGHIKRSHVGGWKQTLMTPARFVPFLASAYSRSCEYTCDAIGFALCPEGALPGMLILASGTQLYKKINHQSLLADGHNQYGFALWISEIFATHPHLIHRIAQIQQLSFERHVFGGAAKADSGTFNTIQQKSPLDGQHSPIDERTNHDKNPLL